MNKLMILLVAMMCVCVTMSYTQGEVITGTGRITGHLYDATNLYDSPGQDTFPSELGVSTSMLPRPIDQAPAAPAIGDESRTVFCMDQFIPGVDLANNPGIEMAGLTYNLKLVAIGGNFPNVTLYFANSTRNGLSVAADVDGDIQGINYGGVIELYQAQTKDLDLSAGPSAWVEGQPGRDTYPTASDGDLWLQGVFVEVPAWTLAASLATTPSQGEPIVFAEVINWGLPIPDGLGTFTGHGEGYVNVFGGSYAENIGRGTFASTTLGADIQIQTVLDFAPLGPGYGTRLDPAWGWQVESDDPLRFEVVEGVIPEPMTLLTVGLGASLLGWIRRRIDR